MRSFLASLILFALSPLSYAEYYVVCHEPVLNVITINCRGHHCSFGNHHVGQPYREHRVHHWSHVRHRHHHYHHARYYRDVMGYCDLDGATGDDNPCQDPNMQIN